MLKLQLTQCSNPTTIMELPNGKPNRKNLCIADSYSAFANGWFRFNKRPTVVAPLNKLLFVYKFDEQPRNTFVAITSPD